MSDDWVQQLGDAICRQWGIDPGQCTAIDVHWRPGQLPYARVSLLLNEGVVGELLSLVPLERHPYRDREIVGTTVVVRADEALLDEQDRPA